MAVLRALGCGGPDSEELTWRAGGGMIDDSRVRRWGGHPSSGGGSKGASMGRGG